MRAMPIVAIAVGLEVLTAGVLLVAPATFARLLLGAELPGAGQAIGRLAGIALLALALACWPLRGAQDDRRRAGLAMLVFSVLCALFVAHLGGSGGSTGRLLWPAAVTHGVLAALLLWKLVAERRSRPAS